MQLIDNTQKISGRPLGLWEHMFWLYDQACPIHFSLTAQVRGEFSIEQLKQALAQVQQRHSLLRVSIALDKAERPWFIENSAKIPIRVVQRQGEEDWKRELEQEISTPFVWIQAPLVRVVLLHSTNVSEIIVTCHHSIADGMSALYLIRDILQVLAKPNALLQALPEIPPQEFLIPKEANEETSNNTSLLNEQNLDTQFSSRNPILKSVTCNETLLSSSYLSLRSGSLTSETTELLIARSQQEQTTVHGVICAAFLKAIIQQNCSEKPQNINCLSAINTRNYLIPRVGENIGLYHTGLTTLHTLTPSANLYDIARSVKQQLNQGMAPDRIFEGVSQLQAWISTNPTPSVVVKEIEEQFQYDLVVTNLGRITFSQYFDGLKLHAIYGPVGFPSLKTPWFVGVTTVEKQLFFTLVCKSTMLQAKAENIQQEAMQLLNTAIKS
ncbi:MAG: condensation domain-containing protein [Cyanobacteria bacterium P01_A01_bin.84]